MTLGASDRGAVAVAAGDDELARRLWAFARSLQQEVGADRILARTVSDAVALVPGADEASISVVTGHLDVRSEAVSGPLAPVVDVLHAETAQGPCLDAVVEQHAVRAGDLRTDGRWPQFGPRAARAGVAAVLSFPLPGEGVDLRALTLLACTAGAFDETSERVGLLFATHAAVALAGARTADELRASMATRDLIGMAKGILMERHKVTGVEAFGLLAGVSQDTNRKLRDVADDLVHSGQLPARSPSRRRP